MTTNQTTCLPVLCYGEALVDMLAEPGSQPQKFLRYAGGAPANVAVAVAKLGGDSRFSGIVGEDMFGEFLTRELAAAGVDISGLLTTKEANTALAFVALDEKGERSFSFYRNPSADMLFKLSDFSDSTFETPGLMHICSNTLTTEETFQVTLAGVQKAKDRNWLISFDLNLRQNLWPTGLASKERIWELMKLASIIKMSKEELDFMGSDVHEIAQLLMQAQPTPQQKQSLAPRILLVTDGEHPVQVIWSNSKGQTSETIVSTTPVKAVDTTGAGDAFSGAVLYQLSKALMIQSSETKDASPEKTLELFLNSDSTESDLRSLIQFAARCGGYAVTQRGAFAAMPSLKDIKAKMLAV